MPSGIQWVLLSTGKCSWRRKLPPPFRPLLRNHQKKKNTHILIYVKQVTVWQCVTTPIKVVPRKQESDDESQTTQSAPGQPDNSAQGRPITPPARSNLDRPTIPLRNHGKGNWESLWWVRAGRKGVLSIYSTIHKQGEGYILNWILIPNNPCPHRVRRTLCWSQDRKFYFTFFFGLLWSQPHL